MEKPLSRMAMNAVARGAELAGTVAGIPAVQSGHANKMMQPARAARNFSADDIYRAVLRNWISRTKHLLDGNRHAAFFIAQGDGPSVLLQLAAGIAQDKGNSGKLKHFHIVVVVPNGHDLVTRVTAMPSPAGHGVSFRAARVQDVHNAK